ncbi:MAG TPA: MFS transporter [Nonomuraea sp.]|nr:MFS transporter [Nonomuraea sp.]
MTTISPALLDARRRRALWTLVAGVALGSTGHIAAVTVATIVAQDLTGMTSLSGLPGATVVIGAAAGSTLLSALMARHGRRRGLVLGYLVAVLGALVATAAVVSRSFPLLLLGTVLIGFGNTANHLSRYAAADMVPASKRATAIGTVVWGSTVGAVVGPNLVGWAGGVATAVGLPVLSGAYLIPIVFVGIAAAMSFALLRPDPYELADQSTPTAFESAAAAPVSEIIRRPAVIISLATLVLGQFVMVLIMNYTPLHMTSHGHGLGTVGLVMSAHTFGMFALSPISGRLTGRLGYVPVILLGSLVLAIAAVLASSAPPDGGVQLFAALFLLGWGWNLGFVAGSAMLSGGVSLAERTRLQGLTDAFVWSTGAVASMSSGIVASVAGYTALGIGGLGLVILLAFVVLSGRQRLVMAA